MELDQSDLAGRFIRWCRKGGASESEAEELWSALSALYQEPHRHYHNLTHIAASLAELDATEEGASALEGAIWFHDVIYDPTRSDNEEASIVWFDEATAEWLASEERSPIFRLISATDFRLPRSDNEGEALMADIDLAILSADWVVYDAYRRAVRREYAHVPDEAFRAGRAKVMASFLEKPIYRTPHFIPREEKARENISRELDLLASGGQLDG
ncbi:HD domain-containing protein [Luteolibacter soli]|uniref:N-methyl-D-aspartate receptor NMDAR2C subunit n=1 Tax=Luteolibacter soli TaxID=3135280 RepID=A0ABU9B242_9BACT